MRLRTRRYTLLLPVVALLFLPGLSMVHGELLETTLTMGPEYTTVREIHRVTLVAGEQDVVFDSIPLTADLSSLTIRTRRLPVDMLAWQRLPSEVVNKTDRPPDTLYLDGHGRRMDYGQAQLPESDGGLVRCRLSIPVGGTHTLLVSYVMRGLTWRSEYQVLIRGDLDGLEERISIDLLGSIRFDNQTGRAFSNALVRLAGSGEPRPEVPRPAPGFLMLEEGPLADLWKPSRDPAPMEYVYRLPRRVNLDADAQADMSWIVASRIPASRKYVLDPTDIGVTTGDTRKPLRQRLEFQNTSSNGLGWVLPAGPVEVFQGTMRRHILQEARLPHTGIRETIQIDLGPARDVLASRRQILMTAPEPGITEEGYMIVIENNRPHPIATEIIIRPETSFAWEVARTTDPADREVGRALIRTQVPARGIKRVEYRLRFQVEAFRLYRAPGI